jgi:hypothetical protein
VPCFFGYHGFPGEGNISWTFQVAARDKILGEKLPGQKIRLGLLEALLGADFPDVGIIELLASGTSPIDEQPLCAGWSDLPRAPVALSKSKRRKLERSVGAFRRGVPSGFSAEALSAVKDEFCAKISAGICSRAYSQAELEALPAGERPKAISYAFPIVQRKYRDGKWVERTRTACDDRAKNLLCSVIYFLSSLFFFLLLALAILSRHTLFSTFL